MLPLPMPLEKDGDEVGAINSGIPGFIKALIPSLLISLPRNYNFVLSSSDINNRVNRPAIPEVEIALQSGSCPWLHFGSKWK